MRPSLACDDATLLDIANAAHLIPTVIQGMTKEAFRGELKTQSAVRHQVMVIGAAVKRLSQALRERPPMLPWAWMAGMRHHLMQGYDAVDLEAVWKTATWDVPEVPSKLEPLLPRLPGK